MLLQIRRIKPDSIQAQFGARNIGCRYEIRGKTLGTTSSRFSLPQNRGLLLFLLLTTQLRAAAAAAAAAAEVAPEAAPGVGRGDDTI